MLVGRAYKATNKPGQTLAIARVWGNHFAMHHQNPLAGIRGNAITFGATAEHGTRFAATFDEPKTGLRGATRSTTSIVARLGPASRGPASRGPARLPLAVTLGAAWGALPDCSGKAAKAACGLSALNSSSAFSHLA